MYIVKASVVQERILWITMKQVFLSVRADPLDNTVVQ